MRVEPLLRDAVGMWQDDGRDNVLPGYAWEMKDFLPGIAGAELRGRGAWEYVSGALASQPGGLLWAPFPNNDPWLIVTTLGGQAYRIAPGGTTATLIGSIPLLTRQNPIWFKGDIFLPQSGVNCGRISYVFGVWAIDAITNFHFKGRYGTVFRDRLVLGNSGYPDHGRVGFSKPADAMSAWDTLSYVDTNAEIKGLASTRNQVICFHADWVEQIRGTTPPDSTLSDPLGDMELLPLHHGAGCIDGRSISYWRENVLFADERGVHITDGGQVHNLIEMGGMGQKWRKQFDSWAFTSDDSVGATVFGNYYICTVRVFSSGIKLTWVCHLPTKRWYTFTNIDSNAYATSSGTVARLYATQVATSRATNLQYCFDPKTTANQQDGNGTNVLPEIETAWVRLSRRVGMRRIFDVFVSYLGYRLSDPGTDLIDVGYVTEPEDTTYASVGGLRQLAASARRKLEVGRRVEGIAFRIRATQAMADFRLHAVGVSVEAEEESRT